MYICHQPSIVSHSFIHAIMWPFPSSTDILKCMYLYLYIFIIKVQVVLVTIYCGPGILQSNRGKTVIASSLVEEDSRWRGWGKGCGVQKEVCTGVTVLVCLIQQSYHPSASYIIKRTAILGPQNMSSDG